MNSGNQTRTRSDRVSQIELPPGRIEQLASFFRRGDVLLRIGVCVLTVVTIWIATAGWQPPFSFRAGDIPSRDITARVEFHVPDEEATRIAKEDARGKVECVYDNEPSKIADVREALRNDARQVISAESYEKLDKEVWQRFLPQPASNDGNGASVKPSPPGHEEMIQQFEKFTEALRGDQKWEQFDLAIRSLFRRWEYDGILEKTEHKPTDGRMAEIQILVPYRKTVSVDQVNIDEIRRSLPASIAKEENLKGIVEQLVNWISPRLVPTLSFNSQKSTIAADELAAGVSAVERAYPAGGKLAMAGKPLGQEDLELLKTEHHAYILALGPRQRLAYALASFGTLVAIFALCGWYMFVTRRRQLYRLSRLSKLLGLIAVSAITSTWLAWYWRAELIPMILFAMTAAIAYKQELALLLSAAISLLLVVTLGYGMSELLVLTATLVTVTLLLRFVRNRTKLIYVGFCTSAVSFLVTLGAGVLADGRVGTWHLQLSAWNGFSAVLSGVIMTGLLPFAERLFKVQTDLSLLELGDVAHPLLQELVRRAPGTYNHSINVASMAEAAADAIYANGLLVRVGAYFHDIGKMLKPGYFIENQGESGSRHDNLVPAMSTLIIIAHVKDGADLARQHHLPQPIIDFILQHHGTTLVEYFYNRANRESEQDPEKGEVDEGSFRYPGPKPQSKEAATLMLADCVESAARSLVDPTPSRLEGLVRNLSLKRLLDDQFDECGLTLRELRVIEDSLVKSLASMYHGRVQYPERQQTA